MTKHNAIHKEQKYKQGVGGYDAESRRWRDAAGRVVKKQLYFANQSIPNNAPSEVFGFSFNRGVSASDQAAHDLADSSYNAHNRILAAATRLQDLITYDEGMSKKVMPIPTQVLAAMNLSEHYLNTEGDVFQHLEAPIDVITGNPLRIYCADSGVQKTIEEQYERLNMWNVLYQCFMSIGYYGQAFPLEVYEKPEDEFPAAIIMLPPKFIWVGYYSNYGDTGIYNINPFDDSAKWTDQLLDVAIKPMTYNAFQFNWREQVNQGWGIPINNQYLHPIRGKGLDYDRYVLPPIQRSFLPISERFVYREAVRAIIEGHRSQLWTYLLGDADHPPTVQEMSALKSTVSSLTGGRTGNLAWRGNLKVDVHVPKGLDQLLGVETRQAFTMDIFRSLGSNMRIVSGNSGGIGGREGSAFEFDISVWLSRIEWMRNNIIRWEQGFRRRLAERNSKRAFRNKAPNAIVNFADSPLMVSDKIKSRLQPLYQFGLLSRQTTLEEVNYSYETELQRKKAEAANSALFAPAPTYSQTTVNPSTPEKRSDTTPLGRTPDVLNPEAVKE